MSPVPDLVRDLASPAAYPEPRPPSVTVVTTHISWVFLAGPWVYKVKRPVRYGFCDFSTLEKRRWACEEELRVNRPLGGEVYVDLVPIFATGAGAAFVGPPAAPPFEWAVRMHRLSEVDNALSLLGAGELGARHLERLAARLADFYAQAKPAPEAGGIARLRAMITTNLDELASLPATSLPAPATAHGAARFLGELRARLDDRLARHEAVVEARLSEGHVRDGHGDLRLEHVYFLRGQPDEVRVLDAIEFNRAFRTADVALDFAFLAMELDGAGHPRLAAWFLSMLARARNDYGFYPLLDIYLAHRALVRAKVAALLAATPDIEADKAARKRTEAAALLALAARYTGENTTRPFVVCVGGLIGSGKSTLAEAVALAMAWPVVSSDHTRKHLAGVPVHARGPQSIYDEDYSRRTLEAMLAHADAVLTSGRGVILDATFRASGWRQAARDLAERHGADFLQVETTAPESVLRERLRARDREGARSVSDAREALLDEFLRRPHITFEIPDGKTMVVDTGGPMQAAVDAVCRRLS